MSNVRWSEEAWEKVTPRHWRITNKSSARFFYDSVDIYAVGRNAWDVQVNGKHIATFPTWDEASQAAPMLYQLHKDTT